MKRKIRVVAAAMAVALSMHICMPVYAEAMSGAQPDASRNLYRTVNSEVDLDGQTMDEELTEAQGDTVQDNTESTPVPEATPVLEATAIPESTAVPESTPAQESEPEPTQTPVPEETPAPTESAAPTETPVPTQTPAATETPAPESDDIEAENTTTEPSGEEQNTKQDSAVYQDGVILLYTYEQLCAVGSGRPVMTGDDVQFGSGEPVLDEQGQPVLYALDVNYQIVEDIPLESVWTLPADFTGHFVSDEVTQDAPLYDSETDTIYIYHNYQLLTIASEDAAQEPVMSNDIWPEQFGTGQFVYPDGQPEDEEGAQAYLTYDPSHHYALSRSFTEQMPQMIATLVETRAADPAQLGGREHIGQVYTEINGTKYILIGNAQQLQAIGSDKQVAPMLFLRTEVRIIGFSSTKLIPYYPGDADLNITDLKETGIGYKDQDIQNGATAFQYLKQEDVDKNTVWGPDFKDDGLLESVVEIVGGLLEGILSIVGSADRQLVGLVGENTSNPSIGADDGKHLVGVDDPPEFKSFEDIKKEYQDLKYSEDGNYIVFRDINLNTLNSNTAESNWRPISFAGTMIGAKALDGQKITDGSTITATGTPAICNLRIEQNSALDVSNGSGVGLFGTIYNTQGNLTGSTPQTVVRNLRLEMPVVHNRTTETEVQETLINLLLTGLGGLVGDIVDGVLGILGIDIDLTQVLTQLLDARKNEPSALATGAFAGRIKGNVLVTDCYVDQPNVSSVNSMVGNFAGYVEGETQYLLGDELKGAVTLLSGLLNIVPGLGLGDLITILLQNGLTLDQLIPTGYANAQIENCQVSGASGTIGNEGKDYIGGFVGLLSGSTIKNSSVSGSYSVSSNQYGGGFVGLARDADIRSLLSNLGVDLVDAFVPQSLLYNCSVNASTLTVEGGNYQGGFAGALAGSYAINDSVEANVTVTGTAKNGSSIGGFAGIATTGWVTNLGANEESDTLLESVKKILLQLLSANPDKSQMLLSLVGISPSAIMGCSVNRNGANTVTVSGDDYVGGFLGSGDGVYLTSSSPENLAELDSLSHLLGNTGIEAKEIVLNVLSSVQASGDYAGGIAGSVKPASVVGLLNQTLDVGAFLGFTVNNFQLSGPESGLTVTADRYAGGAFGEAVGGSVDSVTVQDLYKVEASNYAGGFVGVCGPGDLASTGGLTLNLLGLDNLLKIDSLLSVIPGVKVELTACTVTGVDSGYTVQTDQQTSGIESYVAGGFVGHCNSAKLINCHTQKLEAVIAANGGKGTAGGFVGISRTGALADIANDDGSLKVGGELISAENLLGTINYMVPTYTNCTASYVDSGYVQGRVAGGFAGDFQSGKVNNQSRGEGKYYAVYNIDHVSGQTYAGGFAGKLYSGALADAGGGISILGGSGLNIDLGDLLQVVNAYVPVVTHAGVNASDVGLAVSATDIQGENGDLNAGSAGGFAGYASGAQVSTSDVNFLRHTRVTDPTGNADADAQALNTDGGSYYADAESAYAVTGGRYAGGYIGKIDIGSAASVGGGLSVLGVLDLQNILSALNVVVTTVEHSDVYGAPGGYAVRAAAQDGNDLIGHAGGFAGTITGGHIQDSHAHNFSHIIGRESAGGYVGEMKPGDVAKLLPKGDVLNKLLNGNNILSGLQVFVPTIRNSSTDSVPCGGVVWAQAESTGAVTAGSGQTPGVQRGMAGGYVGHNEGGQILGLNTDPWLTATDAYTGPTSLCKAVRIRTVFGSEYAGGYTGFMESADMADAGTVSLLGDLIQMNNILSALQAVYPMQENTAVYGPLADLDVDTWNRWVEFVGAGGGYGFELAQTGTVKNQDELDQKLANYIYGFNVVAGRSEKGDLLPNPGGDAGGYVGLMRSGVLTNCMAYDVKSVQARGAAGGFAGRAEAGGAASLGGVNILGLTLELDQLVNVAKVFVPVVKNSSVQGYRSGLTVEATGTPAERDDVGYAGGFVGAAYGAQIQLNDNDLPNTKEEGSVVWASTYKYPAPVASCDVRNLRRVAGRSSVGGYVGLATAASLASVNTNASDGLLQGILDKVISSAGDLVDLLPATVTTIHKANVSAADPAWGFVVDGAYAEGKTTQYAPYAGGFVGQAQAAFLGEDQGAPGGDDEGEKLTNLTVTGLRQVDGGLYAGGFVGLGDVRAVAQVGGTGEDGSSTTTILDELLGGLLDDVAGLNPVDVLDVLRTYIYHASVTGVEEGYRVQAHANPQPGDSAGEEGSMGEKRYAGCAGGFAGAMLNGTILDSTAANAATVRATNYTGGFVGHMGKSGVVDVDNVSLLDKLVNANAGVLDLFGTQVQRCTLTGYANGLEVIAIGGQQPIAGGFAGYGDLGRVENSTVTALKKVSSDQVAGGFIGQTDMAYLVSLEADSPLVKALLIIVNKLLDYLYLDEDELQDINLVDLDLGVLKVEVLSGGNALKVELLGIPIVVALSKASVPGQEDVAIITIGDSEIRLPCSKNEDLTDEDLAEVEINLIKGNRTEVDDCTVTGIDEGYDVFAGGAGQDALAVRIDKTGSAGGFVGYNHEGKISNSKMVLCDVVKGVAGYVGPFTGYNDLKSVYTFNDIASIEGDGNQYSIYRASDPTLTYISSGDNLLGSGSEPVTAQQDTATGVAYNRYVIDHIKDFEKVIDTDKEMTVFDMFKALDGAVMTGDEGVTPLALDAYQENGAKAVLMLDTPTKPNPGTMVPEPGVMGDPCSEKVDLKVQKIWDDWFNLGEGREEVTLIVYQQKFTLQEKNEKTPFPQYPAQVENPEESVTMVWAPELNESGTIVAPVIFERVNLSEADKESTWSAVWSKVLKKVPVFEFEDKPVEGSEEGKGNGIWDEGEKITAYYVYTVVEENVPAGYTVSYDFYNPIDAGDYELTVTNKLNIPLPDTGAGGDILFVVVGVGILLWGLTLRKRRPRGKGES